MLSSINAPTTLSLERLIYNRQQQNSNNNLHCDDYAASIHICLQDILQSSSMVEKCSKKKRTTKNNFKSIKLETLQRCLELEVSISLSLIGFVQLLLDYVVSKHEASCSSSLAPADLWSMGMHKLIVLYYDYAMGFLSSTVCASQHLLHLVTVYNLVHVQHINNDNW